jgi:hypothetical protein
VIWVVQSIQFGYICYVGGGDKIRLWEDTGSVPPCVVQFFEIYAICNEQGKTIKQIWDESKLKVSFRRNFNSSLMQLWNELEAVATIIVFIDNPNSLIWQFKNSGVCSTSSLYYH